MVKVPSIGRVVHYVMFNGEHAAADIVRIKGDGSVVLFVKDPFMCRTYFVDDVPYIADAAANVFNSWHWPEYVPDTPEPAQAILT